MRRVLSSRRCAAEWGGSCCSSTSEYQAAARGGGKREKVVVIMGATGTGKSKLSIDLAVRMPPAEVVNSDKMQVYAGLDLTTNKITAAERCGVRHHLLGELDPAAGELSAAGFRSLGGAAVADIAARRRLPIVAGGSNSFIHALMVEDYRRPLSLGAPPPAPPARLRYRGCLLWVDVSAAALYEHLDRRVEEMLAAGMFEELAANYDPCRQRGQGGYVGPWRAIGVPEFDRYFERFSPGAAVGGGPGAAAAYRAAVEEIKLNTRRLADVQVRKIWRLWAAGWRLRRLDATAAVAAALEGRGRADVEAAWERDVVGPSLEAVAALLQGEEETTVAAAAEEEEEEVLRPLRLRLG
ncbi:unnamed protein product [Spirodela intermedia]|uniref:Uncharacterized protein n=1 Tax=Spirodela intermedia TaxID=51605 RepID=A0A7I8KXL2_SPIIN|nr:unnamed protein product [Spirodela intermedia]